MKSKWTLKHNKDHCTIVNEGGKNIGYQPNAGVQIMEMDGFGFKDLNGSGHLDAFEDWRLSMKQRIEDFCRRFGIRQAQGELLYHNGRAALPKEVMEGLMQNSLVEKTIQEEPAADRPFLSEHRLLVALMLILDEGNHDYVIQLMIESAKDGLLNSVIYTIANTFLQFNRRAAGQVFYALTGRRWPCAHGRTSRRRPGCGPAPAQRGWRPPALRR